MKRKESNSFVAAEEAKTFLALIEEIQ